MNKDNIILGIESSCDDTSAAILINGLICSNVIANQSIHEAYGGVVPELASRAHQENIVPVIDQALKQAQITIKDINAVAFTRGPGLLGSLLVGTSFAKSLALALEIPLLDVHHMKAHIHAHFIKTKETINKSVPNFPFLCLTVSGGHTQIVLVESPLKMEIIGETLDDAVGEAFDKAAKVIGLNYPGGPLIDRLAQNGNQNAFQFTFPKVGELNYSFSGLKTQFLNFINKEKSKDKEFLKNRINDVCASYQKHLINYLLLNFEKAMIKYSIKDIAIAGGVSANSELRKSLNQLGDKYLCNVHIPDFEYCTDNAAMIAMSGQFLLENKTYADQGISPLSRMNMD